MVEACVQPSTGMSNRNCSLGVFGKVGDKSLWTVDFRLPSSGADEVKLRCDSALATAELATSHRAIQRFQVPPVVCSGEDRSPAPVLQ